LNSFRKFRNEFTMRYINEELEQGRRVLTRCSVDPSPEATSAPRTRRPHHHTCALRPLLEQPNAARFGRALGFTTYAASLRLVPESPGRVPGMHTGKTTSDSACAAAPKSAPGADHRREAWPARRLIKAQPRADRVARVSQRTDGGVAGALGFCVAADGHASRRRFSERYMSARSARETPRSPAGDAPTTRPPTHCHRGERTPAASSRLGCGTRRT